MQDVVRAQPELRIIGNPSFCFSFTSDEFDIYHVNDAMKARGWRLNGQQYPNAIHMAVTRPQTQDGVLEAWQRRHAGGGRRTPTSTATSRPRARRSTADAVAPTAEITAKINKAVASWLDAQQSLPPEFTT